jgi:dTDP-glucose pyrophosphorylase
MPDKAALFVQTIAKRFGSHIACLEEIAGCIGWIDDHQPEAIATALGQKNSYGQYLNELLRQPS